MQQYAENAVQEHMKKLQQSYYTHLGKQEPWDKNPAILKMLFRTVRSIND